MTNDTNFKKNYTRSTSLFWENAAYLCAREISLSYDLPSQWTKKAMMEKVTVTLTGQNLFYVTSNNLYTPEYDSANNTRMTVRADALPKTVLMGIKVVF